MKALFWLAVGAAAGASGYRYWLRNGGRIPSLERLGSQGQMISEQSQRLHQAVSGGGTATSN